MEKNKKENINRKILNPNLQYESNNSFFENLNSSSIIWLTTKEAAEYLRTTPKQVRKWVYQGKVKAFRLCGKSLRFKLVDLDLLFKGDQTWV